MDPLGGICPLDNSPLLFFGWSRQHSPGTGVTYHFCPRCEVGFLALDDRASGGEVQVMKTHEKGLVPHQPHSGFSTRLSEEQLLFHHQELRDAVARFVTSREGVAPGYACSATGDHLRMGPPWTINVGKQLVIRGCDGCRRAEGFLRDASYGWSLIARFSLDEREARWAAEPGETSPDPVVLKTCLEMLGQVRPWDSERGMFKPYR